MMRKAIFIVMGAILAVGIAFAQTDPWWHPLNPQGASAGVSYGTQLPTLVNTGFQPTDGLLAVQITTGAAPTFNIYDQTLAAWFTFGTLGAAGLTDDTIPVWDTATNSFIDSGIVDDANTITITSGTDVIIPTGQLELGFGTEAAPSFAFLAEDNAGMFRPVAQALGFAVNGIEYWRMNAVQLASRTNFGAVIKRGAPSAALPTYSFLTDVNTGLYRIGVDNVGMTLGGALVMDWAATNAAGAGADLVTISSTLGIMNGAEDIVAGLNVLLTNVNHTGGNVFGIDIRALAGTGADANANEYAINFADGWDQDLFFAISGELQSPAFTSTGTVVDIDEGITQHWLMNPTLTANDNANDQRNVLLIDVDIPNGSAGLVNGINIDGITDDIQTLDSAIFIEGGWDSQITFTDIGRAASANPLTGTVWMFLTDTTDYDGGAADCAIVFRDSAGNEAAFLVVVSNGVCP